MQPIQTSRLVLRELVDDDAAFILELVNDPSWLRHIGDKGVRDLDGARAYIANGPHASYARFGFGLWRVDLKETGTPIGLCGLLKRDTLDDVDIGFALLERHRGFGYAREAAEAVVEHGTTTLGLRRIAGIVLAENGDSIGLLEALGMRREGAVEIGGEALELYLLDVERASP